VPGVREVDVDAFITALAPAFAAGLAVQRGLDILDPVLEFLGQGKTKKMILGLVSFGLGLGLALLTNIRVLATFGVTGNDAVDLVATALVVSAGTETLNSLLKYLGYKKEEQHVETDVKTMAAGGDENARAMLRSM
jgi:hypothetical protein